MAERALKTLHKSAEGAESKMVIESKAFVLIKHTLDDKSSDREVSNSTVSLTRATTYLVPLCKPVVKQSFGINIRYMELKKDFAVCHNEEVALRTQTAECSSAESTLAQQAQLCGGDFDTNVFARCSSYECCFAFALTRHSGALREAEASVVRWGGCPLSGWLAWQRPSTALTLLIRPRCMFAMVITSLTCPSSTFPCQRQWRSTSRQRQWWNTSPQRQ